MKNIKKALKVLTLSSILCITLSTSTFAATSNNEKVLLNIQRYEEPKGGWCPGISKDITFIITNKMDKKIGIEKIFMTSKSNSGISSKIDLLSAYKEMDKNTNIIIKDKDKILVKNKITLEDILSKDGVKLDSVTIIPPNGEKELTMTIDMNEKMGNDTQSLTRVLTLGAEYVYQDSSGGGGHGGNSGGGSGGHGGNSGETEETIKSINPVNPINPENPVNPVNPGKPVEDNRINNNKENTPEVINKEKNKDVVSNSTNQSKPNTIHKTTTSKLPQTGGFLDAATLTSLGVVSLGVGLVLDKKSSGDKGGKSDE